MNEKFISNLTSQYFYVTLLLKFEHIFVHLILHDIRYKITIINVITSHGVQLPAFFFHKRSEIEIASREK